MRCVRMVAAWGALVMGCMATGPRPPTGGSPEIDFAARDPATTISAGRSTEESREAGFWVLPPRLERRFARWLCGASARKVSQVMGAPRSAAAHEPRPGTDEEGSPRRAPARLDAPGGAWNDRETLSPYDGFIRASAARHEMDWLLIAALIFQESRFNPCLASSAGAVGLAQVLPSTAAELGILDPWKPAQNIEAGTRYLRRMYDVFAPLEEEDRVALALASYTAGLGHVLDACSLSAVDGRDPTQWAGNVEETLAQLSNADFAARASHGGACGHQAVAFVNLVIARWNEYTAGRDSCGHGGVLN